MEILKNIKQLKKEKTILECIFIVLIFSLLFFLLSTNFAHAQFNPKDISNLKFFVESKNIDVENHIAKCESDFCLNHPNTEAAIITEQYCDVSNSCAEGCVRRWIDQSDYIPSGGFNPPEYTNGRNFGQDDSEKPCYISDCINGKPCIRGGAPYGDDGNGGFKFKQDKYLEIQIPDFIYLTEAFSIFILAKPIDQTATGNWAYYGQSNSFLRHNVSANNLQLRVPGNFVANVSTNNSIILNEWQIIEVHRDDTDKISVYINGVDKTYAPDIVKAGTFVIGYLLSNFKTTGQVDATGMYGDLAAFLVYDKQTSNLENNNIRKYFTDNYLDGTLSTELVLSHAMKIYPNPAHNYINVKIKKGQKELMAERPKLFNSIGKEFKISIEKIETKEFYEFRIQLYGKLNKGFYLIKFGDKTIKFIKS